VTVGGVAGEGGQGPAPTAKKDAGLTPQRTRGVPTNRGKARRYASNSRDLRVGSGGFLKFEFSGVAEGVEDAKEEIGGDVFGIPVHDGRDACAGSTSEASDLSVRQALALNDFDDF